MHEDEMTNLNLKEISNIVFFKNTYIFVMITAVNRTSVSSFWLTSASDARTNAQV